MALSKCVLTASVAPCREGCVADLRSFIISPSFVQRPRAPHSHWCSSSARPLSLSGVILSKHRSNFTFSLSRPLSLFVFPRHPPIPSYLCCIASLYISVFQFHALSLSLFFSLYFPLLHTLQIFLSLSLCPSPRPPTHTHCRRTNRLSRDEGETEKRSPRDRKSVV